MPEGISSEQTSPSYKPERRGSVDVFDLAFDAMIAAYELYSLNAADQIEEIEDNNDEIKAKQDQKRAYEAEQSARLRPESDDVVYGSEEEAIAAAKAGGNSDDYYYWYDESTGERGRVLAFQIDTDGDGQLEQYFYTRTYDSQTNTWNDPVIKDESGTDLGWELEKEETDDDSLDGVVFNFYPPGSDTTQTDPYISVIWYDDIVGHHTHIFDGADPGGNAIAGGTTADDFADYPFDRPYEHWTDAQLENAIEELKNEITNLQGVNQVNIIKLQKTIHDMNLILQLLSNMLKAEKDTNESIVRNI